MASSASNDHCDGQNPPVSTTEQPQQSEMDSISTLKKRLTDLQTKCFNALVEKVTEMAREHNVSVGAVLLKSVPTLHALSLKTPETRAEVLKIPDVTEAHFDEFGIPLLKICIGYAFQKYCLALDLESQLSSSAILKTLADDNSEALAILDLRKQCLKALLQKLEEISKDDNVIGVQSIRALSFYMPESEEEFLNVSGITKTTFEAYKFKNSLLDICIGYAAQKIFMMVEVDDQFDNFDQEVTNALTLAKPPAAKRQIPGTRMLTWDPLITLIYRNTPNPNANSGVPVLTEPGIKAHLLEKVGDLQRQCFDSLLQNAEEIAKNENIDVADVLSIQTIRALSFEMPETMEDFLKTPGVTRSGGNKYGTQLLDICIAFSAQKYFMKAEAEDEV